MSTSIVGFKTASADLHRKSPKIFFVCLVVSVAFTAVMLHLSLPESRRMEKKAVVPPVIIHLENIPETRQRVALPAPPKPFVPSGAPLEVNDLVLDDVTIEDTILDNESYPDTPPALFVKSIGAAEEEKELFEYYEVEEVPKRLNNVIPDFPIMAERAGIQGTVTLKVLVGAAGSVDSVEVVDGPEILRKSAIDAAKATIFSPAKFNDRAVACWVIMPYRFVFKD